MSDKDTIDGMVNDEDDAILMKGDLSRHAGMCHSLSTSPYIRPNEIGQVGRVKSQFQERVDAREAVGTVEVMDRELWEQGMHEVIPPSSRYARTGRAVQLHEDEQRSQGIVYKF